MYQEGTEVILPRVLSSSVMSAAAEAGKKVIGVDVDQRYDSETVITSATEILGASVYQVLEAIYVKDNWNEFAGKPQP